MSDCKLIKSLGGAAKVAKMLGYSAQRVNNWERRGIPPREKLKHPGIFLNTKKDLVYAFEDGSKAIYQT